jgi:hypothetical protein
MSLKPFLPAAEPTLRKLCELAPSLLHESSKLMRIAQTVAKVASLDPVLAFIWALQSLASALRQDTVTEEELKVNWLVGTKDEPGFAQASLMRRDFVKWLRADMFSHAVHMGSEENAQLSTILDGTYYSPRAFDEALVFTMPAGEGKRELDQERMSHELERLQAGLAAAPWLKALSQLLQQTFTFTFEAEFGKLADEGSVQFTTFCLEASNASEWSLVEAYQAFFEVYTRKPIVVVAPPPRRRRRAMKRKGRRPRSQCGTRRCYEGRRCPSMPCDSRLTPPKNGPRFVQACRRRPSAGGVQDGNQARREEAPRPGWEVQRLPPVVAEHGVLQRLTPGGQN